MGKWNAVNRPVTAAEMAIAFRRPIRQIERVLNRHQITPLVRIGRLRLYGPAEIKSVYSLIQASG